MMTPSPLQTQICAVRHRLRNSLNRTLVWEERDFPLCPILLHRRSNLMTENRLLRQLEIIKHNATTSMLPRNDVEVAITVRGYSVFARRQKELSSIWVAAIDEAI